MQQFLSWLPLHFPGSVEGLSGKKEEKVFDGSTPSVENTTPQGRSGMKQPLGETFRQPSARFLRVQPDLRDRRKVNKSQASYELDPPSSRIALA